MYSAGYGFGNAPPNFTNTGAGAPQQAGAQQPQQHQQHQQQLMYNPQAQFAGMASQGFVSSATPQIMPGGPAGMMQTAGMHHMAANGQSECSLSCTLLPSSRPLCRVLSLG